MDGRAWRFYVRYTARHDGEPHPELDGPVWALLTELDYHANADGWAWPTLTHVAQVSGYSRRAITDAATRLEALAPALGITVQRRTKAATRWHLPALELEEPAAPAPPAVRPIRPPNIAALEALAAARAGDAPVRLEAPPAPPSSARGAQDSPARTNVRAGGAQDSPRTGAPSSAGGAQDSPAAVRSCAPGAQEGTTTQTPTEVFSPPAPPAGATAPASPAGEGGEPPEPSSPPAVALEPGDALGVPTAALAGAPPAGALELDAGALEHDADGYASTASVAALLRAQLPPKAPALARPVWAPSSARGAQDSGPQAPSSAGGAQDSPAEGTASAGPSSAGGAQDSGELERSAQVSHNLEGAPPGGQVCDPSDPPVPADTPPGGASTTLPAYPKPEPNTGSPARRGVVGRMVDRLRGRRPGPGDAGAP